MKQLQEKETLSSFTPGLQIGCCTLFAAIFFVGAIFADTPDAVKKMFTVVGILSLAWLVYSFVYREKIYMNRMLREFVRQIPRFFKLEKKAVSFDAVTEMCICREMRATPSTQSMAV